MIIKILGSDGDSEQVQMLYEIPSIKNEEDSNKFKNACHEVYNNPDFEDCDYEDVIDEALRICNFKGEQIFPFDEFCLEE